MVKPVKPEEPKKQYETPVLTVHGTVRDLTRHTGTRETRMAPAFLREGRECDRALADCLLECASWLSRRHTMKVVPRFCNPRSRA